MNSLKFHHVNSISIAIAFSDMVCLLEHISPDPGTWYAVINLINNFVLYTNKQRLPEEFAIICQESNSPVLFYFLATTTLTLCENVVNRTLITSPSHRISL